MKKRLFYFFSITTIACISYCGYIYKATYYKKQRFNKMIGIYKILSSTENAAYLKSKTQFNTLELKLRIDSTFAFSENAPFLFDSTGTWEAAGFDYEESNRMHFKSNPNLSPSISQCCGKDSIIRIVNMPPKRGSKSVPILIFKKVR
jgi:hypothetical protein